MSENCLALKLTAAHRHYTPLDCEQHIIARMHGSLLLAFMCCWAVCNVAWRRWEGKA
jgi:transposase